MIEFDTLETIESQETVEQVETITITTEEYCNLVRYSEKLKILRNMMWFSSEKYGSTYSISNKLAAAVFDDEEFLFGEDRLEFGKKIAGLVHDAASGECQDPESTSIGARIKRLRTTRGITQDALGELLGVVKSTVSLWENGKSSPPDSIKKTICTEFGCTMDWLYGMEGTTES